MSEYTHPDADLLSAFAEGALPEHERLACASHLAECADCREIVFLVQADLPDAPALVASPAPPPFWKQWSRWKRWAVPVSAFSALAAAAILVISITAARHPKTSAPQPELMAPIVASNDATAPEAQLESQPALKQTVRPAHVATKPVTVPAPATAAPAAAPAVASPAPAVANGFVPAAPPAPNTAPVELAGITGRVTDTAGGAVPRAEVNLTDTGNKTVSSSVADSSGQFSLDGVQPGRYQLKIQAPGFKSSTKDVDLQPQQIAKADSTLEVGNVAETISVTAEAAAVQTASAGAGVAAAGGGRGGRGGGGRGGGGGGRGGGPTARALSAPMQAATPVAPAIALATQLPNKLPPVATATSGKVMLAADSGGALFHSNNSGKSWKAVKGKWKGKVVRLVTPADAPNGAVFRLSTDSGETWFSRDGSKWNPAAATSR